MRSLQVLLQCSTILLSCQAVTVQAQTASPTDQADAADQTPTSAVDEAAPATEQSPAPDAAPDIVVTGSRVTANGYNAPTPVTVVSSDQLLAVKSSVIEGLRDLPQLAAGTTSARTPSRVTGSGNTTVGGANLRNLGAGRTLVLLDGRRAPLSGSSGLSDINLIPDFLVSRVDVVTGGASAAYGSDAVVGVVNFVLDTKFKGFKFDVNGGISSQGDGELYSVKLAGGTDFAGGRGHLVVSGNFYGQGPISGYDRDWSSQFWARIANPNASQPGQPQYLFRSNVSTSNASFGGLITGPTALRGTSFDEQGNPVPFQYGTDNNGTVMVGDAGARFPFPIAAKTHSQSLFAHADFEVSDGFSLFTEGTYGHSQTSYDWILNYLFGAYPFTIFSDNAFLPDSIRDVMIGQNIPSFTLGKVVVGDGPIRNYATNETVSIVGGFNADIGGSWKADGYVQHSVNNVHFGNTNVSIRENLYAAADAVVDPDTGRTVCRITLTAPDIRAAQGCVPISPFGINALTPEQRAYVKGVMSDYSKAVQTTAGLAVRGSPFSTWAGPVNIAAGAEYRRQSVDIDVDAGSSTPVDCTGIRGCPTILQNQLLYYNLTNVAQSSYGAFDVKEVFGEVLVPLARDVPGLHALDLNAAIRYTDYSTSGGVTTWKIGGTYSPWKPLVLRATRSRDIRAPNVAELFGLTSVLIQNVFDPARGNVASPNTRTVTGANSLLTPEIADTFTAGAAFSQNGFGLSVDYYKIKIKDAITSLTGQQVLNGCADGQASLCGLISRDSAGILTEINASLLNIQSIETAGVDIEASYRTDLAGGRLALRGVATYLDHYRLISPASTIEQSGSGNINNGYNPRWIASASVNYLNGPWSLFIQERFISAMQRETPPTTIDDNHIPATFYTSLRVGRTFDKLPGRPELYFNVDNLFDQDPRITQTSGGAGALWQVTNTTLYDGIGRFFTLGIRGKF
jgi:outer membrane receptor protein involved in Fe transport